MENKKNNVNQTDAFSKQVQENIQTLGEHPELKEQALSWMLASAVGQYTYNFSALGRPIIQYPQDMVAMQELIWKIRPDLIIETGIAHGGSLILSASMLALLDYCDAAESGQTLDVKTSPRRVLGLDIDIRPHNRTAIEAHPMAHKIDMIEGSSIDPDIISQVHQRARKHDRILVCLDSNHTHDHVLSELEAYAPLTSKDSYCIVFDTLIDEVPDSFPDRPWGKGNNPKTAVREYMKILQDQGRKAADGDPLKFEIDKTIENKLIITVAPDGFLRRVKD